MDDLLTGCQNVEEGQRVYKDMKMLLGSAGFQLRKWCSNSESLLEKIKEGNKDKLGNLELKIDSVMKILGLTWNRRSDVFEYSVQLPPLSEPVTKRKVISDVARLFDPLGWIAPTIITAKVFIQKLWLSGIDWDEELPSQLLKEWIIYRNELCLLTNLQIPRWINSRADDKLVELHGFSDASNVAYAAVVYARIVSRNGVIHVNLLTSKTKVAPVKQISIPKLELCGAVLLAKLLLEVSTVLTVPKENIHAWTDSTVVLAWLRSHPSRWKTFIANRVSEILTVLDSNQWSHVQSKDNPADCASRGVKPQDYQNDLWSTGPLWLKSENIIYKNKEVNDTNLEEKTNKVCYATTSEEFSLWNKYSSLRKLVRVVALCRRFLLSRTALQPEKKNKYVSNEEYTEALNVCIRQHQSIYFQEDLYNLEKTGKLNNKSKLTSLSPFVEDVGVLRVGGRLQYSQMSEEMKHPILIAKKSHFTHLLIAEAHSRTLHGGPQLMINYLRTKYWIIDVKNMVKLYVRKCVVCIRHGSIVEHQLMGQLPSVRVTACRPFFRSGVDFAGPISIRTSKGRGHHSYKGYICLFICMATKAVHLEAVSDLTTQGFLAAFKRFVARRGHCADIWSDNGTNFIGAARELKSLFSTERSAIATEIANSLACNGTKWHFIPPRALNFGGLWEAGIKSTKYHLQRVIGNSTLTYEEMATVLTQVEACLNSRPLSQISNNPGEQYALTPGHFLVGEPLVVAPDSNYEACNLSNLKRWQLTQRMLQHFWRRWSQDYITQFFHRRKWKHLIQEPNIGDVVLVREDDLPPAKWLFGIIIDKHEGLDKITRVVSLKCKGNIIKRPLSKICLLPVTE
ncbi:uncharacterized protein LOC131854947 [Achroia grisella]|uniref:uncharacterized protein LOC131854947 n=1 Tax=Achroia grisella TaxID=688607 RepID=UPI0027D2F4A2|nr:uncharacterized protein LOC131854947 [Achroia grisella]